MANDKLLAVEIVTAQSTVYSGKANAVFVQGSYAPFEILFNHAPIVSSLEEGIVKIIDEKDKQLIFVTSTGFVEVNKNIISILVEYAEDIATFNEVALNKQIELAKEKLAVASTKAEIDSSKKSLLLLENKLKTYLHNKNRVN